MKQISYYIEFYDLIHSNKVIIKSKWYKNKQNAINRYKNIIFIHDDYGADLMSGVYDNETKTYIDIKIVNHLK